MEVSRMRRVILFLCLFFSFGCNSNEFPNRDNLIFLAKSYSDFEVGSVIAYVPINKPCVNIVTSSNHYEFCDLNKKINNVNATLDKGAESGVWVIGLKVDISEVEFTYRTPYFDEVCTINLLDNNKLHCGNSK
ncbi:hypothetical protein [Vibrio ordalii]|uniref:hypothetical protein n=2 Tax=Vibrionaceae TaxID=641 RepID=UPI0025766DC8|nr:hypothetical protein [Vibrio ordalii]